MGSNPGVAIFFSFSFPKRNKKLNKKPIKFNTSSLFKKGKGMAVIVSF